VSGVEVVVVTTASSGEHTRKTQTTRERISIRSRASFLVHNHHTTHARTSYYAYCCCYSLESRHVVHAKRAFVYTLEERRRSMSEGQESGKEGKRRGGREYGRDWRE
jgi:hypothetical protein